jgi:metal-dependent HD superfamily phosphatase/phosphodiesterase
MRSQKELALDGKILDRVNRFGLSGRAAEAAELALGDDEVQAMQEYANTVSIKRLNFNDHGPVHVRVVALNALIMLGLLREAGIKTSLEKEEGGFEESLVAVFLASMLHDLGMTIGRQDHELHSAYLSYPILDRLLRKVYAGDMPKLAAVRSLALECIAGHMGTRTIYSLEAGVVQVADGCDMTQGRARIPMIVGGRRPLPGDIHKLSANAIKDVRISKGKDNPIRIEIQMSGEVGLFQVEEVFLAKIAKSTAKSYIELYALVDDGEPKRYL